MNAITYVMITTALTAALLIKFERITSRKRP